MKNKYFKLLIAGLLTFFFGCNNQPTETNADLEEPVISKTIGANGDTISVVNNNGDEIKLLIPANAIEDSTEIILTALNELNNDIFADNLSFGIRLEPAGLMLNEPATLNINFANNLSDTTSATLFNLIDNSTAFPLGNRKVTTSSISGIIYHFSEYGAANPSGGEASSQADGVSGSGAGPFDWQATFDAIDALLAWADYFARHGDSESAQEYLDKACEILNADAQNFLDQPMPDEPCGWYKKAAQKYAERVMLMGCSQQLSNDFSDLINDLGDKCLGRGQIEYDHIISFTDVNLNRTIKGFVDWSFTVFTYPFGDVSGNGVVELNGNGINYGCTLTESVSINVEVSGTLESDDQGLLWLNLELEENWPQHDMIGICPDDIVTSVTDPAGHGFHTIRLLLQEGWTYTEPVVQTGVSGSYTYILHITQLP